MATLHTLTLDGDRRALPENTLDDLRSRLGGEILLPTDESYDEARKIWNGMIDRSPSLLVRCASAGDAAEAVRWARQHDLLVSVRGAGHNIAGKALHDGAVLIDLSQMRSVVVDAGQRKATVAPGATLGDVDAATQAHGLAVPTGINSTTGISGLTLGGGFGWLSRSLGLTIDNLLSVQVVTAEGELLRASEDEHSELFWAIRGGGGNFGIVVEFEFRLHPVGPEVTSGPVVFPQADARGLLDSYREFCRSCPEELTVWAVLRTAPPLPFLDERYHGQPALILASLYNGPMDEGEEALAPLRALGEPWADAVGPHPFAGFQQAFDPLLTPGARNYWKSHNFTELSDGLLDVLVEYAGKLPSDESEIFLAQMGGATSRVPADATAYPHRDAQFVMNVHTRWQDAADDERCVAWAREFYAATEPFATGGVYVNFISEDEERVAGAYGGNYERLAKVKAQYDPDNFFRTNQNIQPKGLE